MWIQTISLCGKHSTTMQIRIVSRFWFLQETLKTQNQHQEDSGAFSEVKHLCQQVGCARNRHQSHTVQQKLRLFLLMQVYAWTEFPRLIFGTWWLKSFIPHQTKPTKPKMLDNHRETCRQQHHTTCEVKFQPSTSISMWLMLITFHQTWNLLVPVLCCMFLRTMKPW